MAQNSPDFRSLFESSPGLLLVLSPDPNFTILAMSDQYAKTSMRDRSDVIGKHLFAVFPDNPDDPTADGSSLLRSSLLRVLKNKAPDFMGVLKYDIQLPGSLKFEQRWWSSNNFPVLNSEGNVTAIIHHTIDVTETMLLKQNEKDRNTERENFRTLFKQTPEMVVILRGPEHIFEFVNDSHIKVLGFDATGKTVREAQPESVEIHGILDEVYRTGKTAELHEIPITVTDRLRFFNLTYSACQSDDGKINGVMIMGVEVSDQVAARENLKKAIKARDEFLSIASHELKTPLTSMKIQSQLFHRKFKDEKMMPMMKIIERGVDRLVHLVDDMLDISRIQLGKLSFHREPIELSQFLEETLSRFDGDFKAAGIEIRTDLTEEITCNIDPFRFEQVITNLVTNATRYAHHAPVEINLKSIDGQAVLTFQDQGPGIKKADHERVFVRFERLHSATEISGMGLGLYICKEIVTGHGGTIEIKDSDERGACFIIKLPVSKEKAKGPDQDSQKWKSHPEQ